MFKTKFVAILLCITTAFTLFAGVTFAENIDMETGEDVMYETLVIEDGKLISGSSELIDSGLIVLGDPDESNGDAVEENGSNRTEIKDNTVSGNSGGASAPTQAPNAVSPSTPTQSASAISAINHPISITNPGTGYCASNNGIEAVGCFTYSGTVGTTSSTRTGTLNRNAHVTIAVLYNINYQIAINQAYTLELSYCREYHGSDNYATWRIPRGLYRVKTQGRYMFNLTNGGTLRIVGGINGEDTEAGTFKVGNDYDKFVIDANGEGESNSATSSGNAPAFYVNNSTLEIKNAIIRDSLSGTSNGKGAAIHVTNGGKVHLENVVFDNCAMSGGTGGTMGGAIHIASGTVTLKNCRITNRVSSRTNFAQDGGAISILSGATSASGNNYLLQIEDTIIEKCRSTNGTASTNGGGAIYVGTLASGQKISIKNSTIQNCYTPGNGGAIHMESGGSLEMEGTTIKNCYSTLAEVENSGTAAGGGGMYIDTTGTVSMTNCTIQSCYSQNGDGGGMFVDSATMTLTGCTLSNNYITDTSTAYTYTLNGTTVNLCAPLKTGAAIYAQEAAKITLTNTKVNNNQQGAAKYARGAIYITRRASVTMGGTSEISNNKGGGGVYIYSKGTFTMNGGTMSGNEYIYHNPTYGLSGYSIGNYGMSNGVAVLLHAETSANYGSFIMNGGTIKNHTNNTSFKGGAVGVMDGGSVEIKGGYIESNSVATSTTFKTRSGATVTYSAKNSTGGAIYMEEGVAAGTLTISGGTIGGSGKGNTAGVGGGVFMGNNTAITMTGGTVSYNSATATTDGAGGGGGIHAGTGTDVYIKSGTIEYNNADVATNGGGGGISVNTPTHFFIGDEDDASKCPQITNNTSVCDGGGVYAKISGIIIFNCQITNNTSKHGGGVYVTNSSSSYTVTMHNGSIDNNESSGVFLAGGNAATTFIMNGGSISGNTIVKTGGHDYGGAGICAINGHSVTINGGTISNNRNLDEDVFSTEDGDTAMNGGGIAMVQKSSGVGTLTITGGTISNNETVGNGGGIYVEDGGILSIKGTADKPVTISGNNAGGKCIVTNDEGGGGGVFLDTLKGSSTAGSPVVIKYAIIKDNSVSDNKGDGGGIWSENTNIDISNSTIQGNMAYTANSNGGGIWFNKPGYTLNVDNCKFIGNHAYGWGGGLCGANPVNVTITNSSFDGNMARSGGGIKLYSNGKATITNTYMGNNETAAFNSTADVGGAINIQSGVTLTIGNCYLGWLMEDGERVAAPNKTLWGGGIYVDGASTLTINAGVDISNNRASRGGGAYFTAGATVTVAEGTAFTNNTSTGNGGGIYTASNLNLNNVVVKGNTAATNGGGMYAIGSINVNLAHSNFDGNSATSQGGGLATYNGANVTVSYTCFGNNSAGKGGAIGVLRNNETGTVSSVVLQDSRIGCLEYVQDDITVASNTADTVGGGLFVDAGCRLILEEIVSICNNIAGTDGGGAYFAADSVIEGLADITVSDNEAGGNGGGIYTATALAITNLIMNGNDAELSGGGLYSDNADISIDNSSPKNDLSISYNTARTGNGGGMCIDGGSVTLNSVAITSNTAGVGGGGLYIIDRATATVDNTVVMGNTAEGGNGGGVLASESSTVAMNGSYIVNNSAQGTFDGDTAMLDVDSVKGVGGGVAVFNGASFTLNISGGKGAIYGNTASTAANDVFANGVEGTAKTKLSIPTAASMDINGEALNGVSVPAYPKANAAWWEDYMAGDTSYTIGLNGDDDLVLRYADMPVSIAAYTNSLEGTSNSGRYVNDQGMFVSITFDVQKHNVGSITIIAPDHGDENQRFVFELTGTTIKGDRVSMTLSIGAGQQVTVTELYAGTYTVTQKTSWSWRYSLNGVLLNGSNASHNGGAVEITVTGVAVTEEYTLEYNNTKTNILWLDHNSPIRTNTATQSVAARIDMAEGKKTFAI